MDRIHYLVKVIIIVGMAIVSMFVSMLSVILSGTVIGELVNPIAHNHYACACDEPPVLTHLQAVILGICLYGLIMIGLNYIIRQLYLPKIWHLISMILLAVVNGIACYVAIDILFTPVSG